MKTKRSKSRVAQDDVVGEVFRTLLGSALFAPLFIIGAWHPVLIPVLALVGVVMLLISHAA